jgi:hypothetical protein
MALFQFHNTWTFFSFFSSYVAWDSGCTQPCNSSWPNARKNAEKATFLMTLNHWLSRVEKFQRPFKRAKKLTNLQPVPSFNQKKQVRTSKHQMTNNKINNRLGFYDRKRVCLVKTMYKFVTLIQQNKQKRTSGDVVICLKHQGMCLLGESGLQEAMMRA